MSRGNEPAIQLLFQVLTSFPVGMLIFKLWNRNSVDSTAGTANHSLAFFHQRSFCVFLKSTTHDLTHPLFSECRASGYGWQTTATNSSLFLWIKFYWSTAALTHWHTFCGYFCSTQAEVTVKPEIFSLWPFKKKLTNPYARADNWQILVLKMG